MNLYAISMTDVIHLGAGKELDELVHGVIHAESDNLEEPALDYSTNFHQWDVMMNYLKSKGDFFEISMNADGYNVIYDFGREVVFGENMLVALCKAIILNYMLKNEYKAHKALLFSEKHGIIEYKIVNDKMIYFERFLEGEWITYRCVVDLNDMEEKREKVKDDDIK